MSDPNNPLLDSLFANVDTKVTKEDLKATNTIDWTPQDKYSENTITCQCGAVFKSHSKFVVGSNPRIVSRKSCPACGQTDCIASSVSEPEVYNLRG